MFYSWSTLGHIMTTKDERTRFSQTIEKRAAEEGSSHMDVIVSYCEETGLEIDMVKDLINPSLKSKIESEAKTLRLLKDGGGSKLPL